MAVLDIVLYPDDPLTQVCEPVDNVDGEIATLVADMFETMDAYEGIGLAGPQVGVCKRVFVLRDPDSGKRISMINPELTEAEGSVTGEEGCLSLPQLYAPVVRAQKVRVRGLNVQGNEVDFVVEEWLVLYNTRRPHRGLGGRTPAAYAKMTRTGSPGYRRGGGT